MSEILPDIDQLLSFVSTPQDVVILTHRNPDGDALGSSLAWAAILRKMHHSITVIAPSEYPVVFEWMPGIKDILIYDIEPEACLKALNRSSLICCLDFNALDRIDKLGIAVHELGDQKKSVLIDHHIDPEPFADVIYSDPSASSTCEMIYKLTQMCEWGHHLDADIASCLYTGILTDTGSFHHAVSSELFIICSKLFEYDFNAEEIHDKIFKNFTEMQLRLLGHCLANRMEILPELKTGIITLTKQDYEDFKIERGDTEGIVNYLLMIDDIEIAAFITEQPTIVKFSFRSKGNISVQQIARDHFNGGGHKNAAGGSMYSSLKQAVEKFKRIVPFYIPTIKSFRL